MTQFAHGSSSLYYEESGVGDPVVLLPGFSSSIADHMALRTALSPDYRVIAVDLPGSGKSGPQPRRYTRTYYEDDARAIAALARSRTAAPVHLLGHSDGGEVALLIAALYPDIARSALVWGAAGAVTNSQRNTIMTFGNVIDEAPPDWADYRAYLIKAYGEDNARAMTRSFATAVLSIIDDGGDISLSMASQITSPVLLVVGEHDMVPKSMIDDYAKQVQLAETIEVKDAGHDLHNTHAEWFMQKVLTWLAAH